MTVSSTYVTLELTVCGVTREVEADVKYIHTPAFGPIYDGSGPVSPGEPENAEIQSVRITECRTTGASDAISREILYLLTDAQIDAIAEEVLEQGA